MASYRLEFSERAKKKFDKLDRYTKTMIQSWINKHLAGTDDPRQSGKALKGNLGEYWRYRVGDYRLIALIKDDRLIILVVEIGHRREIYRN